MRDCVLVADEARHDAAAVEKHRPAAAESPDDGNEGRVVAGEESFDVEKLLRLPAIRQADTKHTHVKDLKLMRTYSTEVLMQP